MRFGKKIEFNKKIIITGFALFPITINNETRWLENVKVEGQYHKGLNGVFWENHRFLDYNT